MRIGRERKKAVEKEQADYQPQVSTKIRSPASAETDQFYCLEAPGKPTATGHRLPGDSRQ